MSTENERSGATRRRPPDLFTHFLTRPLAKLLRTILDRQPLTPGRSVHHAKDTVAHCVRACSPHPWLLHVHTERAAPHQQRPWQGPRVTRWGRSVSRANRLPSASESAGATGFSCIAGTDTPFTLDGLSVVDLGVSSVTATGNVANLKSLADFSGNYVQAGAGAVVGGGAGAAVLRNQNGVEIALTATAQGVRFALSSTGVNVKLKQ